MSCPHAPWLHGYFDGELDAVRAAEFETHLATCTECTAALATQQALRGALTAADLYAKAPAALQARVRAGLRPPRVASRPGSWPGLAVAASILLACLTVWSGATFFVGRNARATEEEVLDAHLRSLQLSHLTDVASTDRHTVKPWFAGKLDFSPDVVDFASDGFPLVGGRLDVVGGRSVAALVYHRRNHVVNVFVWPSDHGDEAAPHAHGRHGYAWVRWTRAGMQYWAVSDIPVAELEAFARLPR